MNFLKKTLNKSQSVVKSAAEAAHFPHAARPHDHTFLHGFLLLDIEQAKDLPDMEGWLSKLVNEKDVTDPFVDVLLGKAKLAKTSVINNNLNPIWNESYRIELCHYASELVFEVRDKDHAYTEFIGTVSVPTSTICNGEEIDQWFKILKNNKIHRGDLKLKIQYVSKETLEKSYEVDCYFPMWSNCAVTLYQDSHCKPSMEQFSNLITPSNQLHEPRSCWKDLYYALIEAREIICITGWAVWTSLKLFRGSDSKIDQRTLGQILVDKANQGVKVFVMVWSEKTSGDILGEKGIMGTHDMETYNFFKKTGVNCALCPREMKTSEFTDYLQNEFSTGAYTHHQKSVICDTRGYNSDRRRLIAFVGGLDLTGGRYDTPDHELFSTLLDEHHGDFRNSDAKSIPPEQGPREPWHDIHCKVEGPIAVDVFENFYERWSKQGTKYGHLERIENYNIVLNEVPPVNPASLWNAQLFRSITDDSAVFDKSKALRMNSKKGRAVDSSIAQAYIQMIRNAENFIYIENQYFLGSAYCWLQNDDTNCHHTIPSEITRKIVDKIKLRQRFCAYIVIPMFPEGDPASAPIQEILYWQTRTIEMMYKQVGEALATHRYDNDIHPTDYLLFLCPGKRELPGEHIDRLEPATEQFAKTFRDSMRFPIYVHSKMMIVDDVYIIVGSANINQRSMAGTRDTEMAIGAWQPSADLRHPRGDVHVFRKSLWTEHLRITEHVFDFPATIECVRRVKEMCFCNWQKYIGVEVEKTPGQLLCYPLNILKDGTIQTIEGVKSFPDFPPGAKVLGKLSAMIPQKVTT